MSMSAITQERKIRDRYDALSSQYQDSKGDNAIPPGRAAKRGRDPAVTLRV